MNNLVQPECGGPNPLVRAANQIGNNNGSTSTLALMAARAAASKHIPSIPSVSSVSRGFTNEFILRANQQKNQQFTLLAPTTSNAIQQLDKQNSWSAQQQSQYISAASGHDYLTNLQNLYLGPSTSSHFLPQTFQPHIQSLHQQNQSTQITAGDQLDEKYRTDLLAQTESAQNKAYLEHQAAEEKEKQASNSKTLDGGDLEFWQSLAQKYNDNDQISQVFDEKLWFQAELHDPQEQVDRKTIGSDYAFDDTNPLKGQFQDPFAEGLKKLEVGDIPSAVLLFEDAVQRDTQNVDAWLYLGTTQAQNENDRLAIRALTASLELDANNADARFALAVSSANEGRHRSACDNLCTWLAQNPKYQTLVDKDQYELSKLNSTTYSDDHIGDAAYSYVQDIFIKAARLSPSNPDPEIQSALGVLFNLRGEYDKAADCFKAALSVAQSDSLLWNRLGATLANGNKSEEAVAAYRKALEISPGFLRSRFNLAISCINLNAYKESAEQLVSILNIQAAGRGLNNLRARSMTSTNIWNTLRTVVTLMNRPELYPLVDGRDLESLNKEFLRI